MSSNLCCQNIDFINSGFKSSGRYICGRYFLPVYVLSFHFLYSVFQNTFFFHLCLGLLASYLRILFLTQVQKRFSPRFHSRNFIVSCFTFGSVTHRQWFLHMVLCTGRALLCFHMAVQMFQHHF